MASKRPVLITAGGTGGHVYPGLAVARELIARDVPVVWMGTRQGMEARVIPPAGIEMAWLSVSGLRGKGLLRWVLAPARLSLALVQAGYLLLRHRPCAVLGMGGFVAGPGGLMAVVLRTPLLIHEQNAVAGLTNRILARLSTVVMEGFPGTFDAVRGAVATGNPVRADIAAIEAPETRLSARSGALRVLVVGGSQGALALNQILPEALALMDEASRPTLWHQVGADHEPSTRAQYERLGVSARIDRFIDDMAEAYAWADFVVCRAGALTIAELCAAGVGALLVPYPHAVDDHQTRNADFMVQAGAALRVAQQALSAQGLADTLQAMSEKREQVLHMACAARALARVDATAQVADHCLRVAVGRKNGLERSDVNEDRV